MRQEGRPRFRVVVLGVLLALGLLLAGPSTADAETITVTSNGEEQAINGLCTLLEALNNANNDALTHPDCLVAGQGGGIVDRIEFNIPPAQCIGVGGVCDIAPTFTYTIVQPVTIDGYTQPSTSPNTLAIGNNAVLRIQIRGCVGCQGTLTGLLVRADDVTLRGLVVASFDEYGIDVESGARTRIVGCFIGTDATGSQARANEAGGIRVRVIGSGATIGGTSPADRNVISGHTSSTTFPVGILLEGASSVTVQGNYIGLKANGLEPLPNRVGIQVFGGSNNTIGGTTAGAHNIISGNQEYGIFLTSPSAAPTITTHVVQGNSIGPRADGAVGSTGNGHGIGIVTSGNTIGGTTAGAGNTISSSAGMNVRLLSGTGNAILGNSIAAAAGLGIDLGSDGVTANDPQDGDGGPNRSQNHPVLSSVGARVNTTVRGALNSTPNRTFRIELFSNVACDPSGYGEGETFLGFVNVTTDGSGDASFLSTFPLVPVGRWITATATDLTTNDTSEFSFCRQALPPGVRISPGPINLQTSEDGTVTAGFNVALDTVPTANVALPISISDPTEGRFLPGTPTSLTFTPTNAMTAQIVQLAGIDDGIDDGNVAYMVVLGPITSDDLNYNGLDPADIPVTNIDNDDQLLQCTPRPRVNAFVERIGGGQLRATVMVNANPLRQNEIQSIRWDQFDTATVVLTGVGPVQQGQTSTFGPLTQSASFVITRTPGAQSGTVRLTVTDACGTWPTFVGAGPNGW